MIAEDVAGLSCCDDADTGDWLKAGNDHELYAQRLQQAEAYAITLLRAVAREDEDDVDEQPGFYPRR